MLLAIDSGNTNIVFAVYDGDNRRGQWRSSSDPVRTADEYSVWLSQLMSLAGLSRTDIDAAIIANVVPATRFSLDTLCCDYFGCASMVIGDPGVELGIEVLIDHPADPGADRLVNAVGAFRRYGGPLIVVDFGTATTFDVVDDSGNYYGGVIAPSAAHSVEALHRAAAQLPNVEVRRPPSVIGKATVPAMQSGIYWGYVALIEGLVARIGAEYGAEMAVVATGGLAPVYADATDVIQHVDPDITMRGLLEIYRRNGDR